MTNTKLPPFSWLGKAGVSELEKKEVDL